MRSVSDIDRSPYSRWTPATPIIALELGLFIIGLLKTTEFVKIKNKAKVIAHKFFMVLLLMSAVPLIVLFSKYP